MHRFASTVDGGAAARPDFGAGPVANRKHSRDGALQKGALGPAAMPAPLFTFEGPSNQDNFDVFGFRVNPPDSDGDVGRNHYVAMINLVYLDLHEDRHPAGTGQLTSGTLWADFPIDECTEPSGDPIVLYDEKADRWILTQFTTRGLAGPAQPVLQLRRRLGDRRPDRRLLPLRVHDRRPLPRLPEVRRDGRRVASTGRSRLRRVSSPTGRRTDRSASTPSIGSQLMAGDPDTEVIEFQLTDGRPQPGRRRPPAGGLRRQACRCAAAARELFVGSQDDDARLRGDVRRVERLPAACRTSSIRSAPRSR